MIPSTSKDFLVRDLVSGREYYLCVLAMYDDALTSLTATRQLGCVTFVTETEYSQCQILQSHFLGGTMIIIIGGIIVASVLVFIIILMIRYKVYSQQGAAKGIAMSDGRSQTNGRGQTPGPGQVSHSGSKVSERHEEQGFGRNAGVAPSSLKDAAAADCDKVAQVGVTTTQRNASRTAEQKRRDSLNACDVTTTGEESKSEV